jgi:hypothetical protein
VNGRSRRKVVTLQAHIQPKTDRKRAGLHQRLPSVQGTPLDSGQPDCHPLAGLGPVHALVVNLDRANAHVQRAGLDAQLVAHTDRARPERPRHDCPDACQGEDAIDPQARREVACNRPSTTSRTSKRCAKLREPFAARCAHADDLRFGQELAGLRLRGRNPPSLDRIDLGHGNHARVDAEQAENLRVLPCLLPDPLAGVHDEQEQVDPGRAGDHVPDESLVTRNVDE